MSNEQNESTPDTTKSARRPSPRVVLSLLIVLFIALIYGPTARFQFLWDDEYFVQQNPAIREWSYIPRYFTDVTTYAGGIWAPMYRPLRNISFLIDYKIAGLNPAWFHLHNVALHIALAVSVFLLFLRLRADQERLKPTPETGDAGTEKKVFLLAAMTTIIWALHPVQVEAVAWVKSRDDGMFGLFTVLSLLCAVKGWSHATLGPASPPRRGSWLVASLVFGAAALLSKEMAVTLPLLGSVLFFSVYRSAGRKSLLVWFLPMSALTVAYIVARHLVIGQTEQTGYLAGSFGSQMLTSLCAFHQYLKLLAFLAAPLADTSAFPAARSIFALPVVLGAIALVASLLAVVGFWVARLRLAAAGGAIFFIALLPVLNIIPTMQHYNDRFLYLPSVGIALILFELSIVVTRRLAPRGFLLSALVLGLLAIVSVQKTVNRLPDWRTAFALHEATYYDSRPSPRITLNYAIQLTNARRYQEGLPLHELLMDNQSLLNREQRMRLHVSMATTLLHVKGPQAALPIALAGLEIYPNRPELYAMLGLIYGTMKDHAKAFIYYSKACDLNPIITHYCTDANTARNLLLQQGKPIPSAAEVDAAKP